MSTQAMLLAVFGRWNARVGMRGRLLQYLFASSDGISCLQLPLIPFPRCRLRPIFNVVSNRTSNVGLTHQANIYNDWTFWGYPITCLTVFVDILLLCPQNYNYGSFIYAYILTVHLVSQGCTRGIFFCIRDVRFYLTLGPELPLCGIRLLKGYVRMVISVQDSYVLNMPWTVEAQDNFPCVIVKSWNFPSNLSPIYAKTCSPHLDI
jgi:hypothetical protein